MAQNILFLAHVSETGNTLPKSAYEVLGTALKLTGQLGAHLSIGLIGENVAAAAETIAAAGAERVLAVSGPDFSTPRYASDAAAAEAICRAAGADLILAPATSRFMRVLAGVALRLKGCVDTHVSALEAGSGELRATRWHYRQRIEAVIRREARPWIVLLDPGCEAAWTGTPGAVKIEEIAVPNGPLKQWLPVSALRRAMRKQSGPTPTCCLLRVLVGPRSSRTETLMSMKRKS